MACGCTKTNDRGGNKLAAANSDIIIYEDVVKIDDIDSQCCKKHCPKKPQSTITAPIDSDVPLCVHLKSMDDCDVYSIDVRDVKNLTVTYKDCSTGIDASLPYKFDAVENDLIHFMFDTTGMSDGNMFDLTVSGELYGNKIEQNYEKALRIKKYAHGEFGKDVLPTESVLDDALFIPSPRGVDSIESLREEYTEAIKSAKLAESTAKEYADDLKNELDVIREMSVNVLPKLVEEIKLLREEVSELKKG